MEGMLGCATESRGGDGLAARIWALRVIACRTKGKGREKKKRYEDARINREEDVT